MLREDFVRQKYFKSQSHEERRMIALHFDDSSTNCFSHSFDCNYEEHRAEMAMQ